MSDPETSLEALVEQVRLGEKYRCISLPFVSSLLAAEIHKGRSPKEAVKAARNKLHQVAAAYQPKPLPYAAWQKELFSLPPDLLSPDAQAFFALAMRAHASTNERIEILPQFFNTCLAPLGRIDSVLDVACGLNPLAISWMPLPPGFTYTACDIYSDMVDFLNIFFTRFKLNGKAFLCDATRALPEINADLTLVLKTIPCLEQMDKEAGRRLLDLICSPNILVSFPAHSLGGRSKGMVRNYERHFQDLIAGRSWKVTRFEFPGELAFLVQK